MGEGETGRKGEGESNPSSVVKWRARGEKRCEKLTLSPDV